MRTNRIDSIFHAPDEKSRGGGVRGAGPFRVSSEEADTPSARAAAAELLRLIRHSPGKYPPGIRRVITSNINQLAGKAIEFDLATMLEALVRRSLNRSRQALLIWDEIVEGWRSGELMEIQLKSDAAPYLRALKKEVDEQRKSFRSEMARGQMNEGEAEFFNSVHTLSISQVKHLIDAIDVFVKDSGLPDERIEGIANAAALTVTCCFLVEMICRGRRCMDSVTVPLVRYFEQDIVDVQGLRAEWPLIKAEMHLAETRAAAISKVINKTFRESVVQSDAISEVARAQVSTALHVANHISLIMHSVGDYGSELESMVGGHVINRSNVERLLSTFNEINRSFESLHAIPLSYEEPVDFAKRAFKCIKPLRFGDVPLGINRYMLNMMLTHFILNAKQYASDERPLEIRLLQSELGVLVQDNGRGMSLQRLALLQDAMGSGSVVKSSRPGGTGSGIRDSMALLIEFLKENSEIGQVAMTIASKEYAGTAVDVRWDGKPYAGNWDHIRVSCQVQDDGAEVMIGISGSVNRPPVVLTRAISNQLLTTTKIS